MIRSALFVLGAGFVAARVADNFWPPKVVEEVGQPATITTYSTVAGIGAAALVAGFLASRCRR